MIALWQNAAPVDVVPGLARRTLATGQRAMLVEFRGQAGAAIGIHQHPAEQNGYVVFGQIGIIIEGVETLVGAGDSYSIPSSAPHGSRFISDSVILETFTPPREDYRV
jgi:quercetin dioxygenase-like cupin family protein